VQFHTADSDALAFIERLVRVAGLGDWRKYGPRLGNFGGESYKIGVGWVSMMATMRASCSSAKSV
jgi:hypothetical protein